MFNVITNVVAVFVGLVVGVMFSSTLAANQLHCVQSVVIDGSATCAVYVKKELVNGLRK